MKRGTIVVVAVLACTRRGETVDTSRAAPVAGSSPTTDSVARVDTTTGRIDSASSARGASATPPIKAKGTAPTAPTQRDSAPPVQVTASDTIRGIVAVVGTEHDKRVIVRPSGERAITLSGTDAMLVGRAAGAEVWVAGTRGDRNTLEVSQFAVRTVDGIPALDGMLVADGDRLVLVTPDGKRHVIAHVPDALRQHVGGRVWISGNLDQGPVAYGIIRDKP
jgi:hypothetical protein